MNESRFIRQDRQIGEADAVRFSEKMLMLLADMSLEEISVQKMCDICNYPRSTFYNYFDDIYDLMDYCWTAIYLWYRRKKRKEGEEQP